MIEVHIKLVPDKTYHIDDFEDIQLPRFTNSTSEVGDAFSAVPMKDNKLNFMNQITNFISGNELEADIYFKLLTDIEESSHSFNLEKIVIVKPINYEELNK